MKLRTSSFRPLWVLTAGLLLSVLVAVSPAAESPARLQFESIPRSRVIILTDMGNEADDSQTMVRLLLYSNRFDIEGLIAVSSCHQYAGKNDANPIRNNVQPTMITERIRAYGQVRANLLLHEPGWPTEEYLLSRVGHGPPGYGMDDVGNGHTTDGSDLIGRALTGDDPRPLYVCINAGANCLAQALWDLRARLTPAAFGTALAKLRVYDDAGQDNAGAWIAQKYPHVRYYRSQSQVFSFMNNNGPVTWNPGAAYPGKGQHDWAREHVMANHGPLGALYPRREKWQHPEIDSTIEGGGTSTWIGHVNHGLYVPEQPTWGGWGGRFASSKQENVRANQLKIPNLQDTEEKFMPFQMVPEASDRWTDPETGIAYSDLGTPIYRWRRAYQNDFQARMDWCVEPFAKANHNPIAALNGDTTDRLVRVTTTAGSPLVFDASASTDPDGNKLSYHWFLYPEAGTYRGRTPLVSADGPTARLTAPVDAADTQLHLILEVRDDSAIARLSDYRRIVIDVRP